MVPKDVVLPEESSGLAAHAVTHATGYSVRTYVHMHRPGQEEVDGLSGSTPRSRDFGQLGDERVLHSLLKRSSSWNCRLLSLI